MPKFLIKRALPGIGSVPPDVLHRASRQSRQALRDLGPDIQWVQSYITDDASHCVYIAPDENLILAHAEKAGIPADAVMQIRTVTDPTTAEA